MSTYNIGIILDLHDITTDTVAAIGMTSGVCAWITGRPSYNSSSDYSGDVVDDGVYTGKFYEGILTSLERIGQPNRMIDITIDGDYGTLSGFSFEVDNTSAFWNTMESNDYYVINRPVDVYIFIDDVSYHVWGGLVSEIKRTETVYTFICEDDFKNVHKAIPPDEVTENNFPNADKKVIGELIPICIGNVHHALCLPVYTSKDPIILCTHNYYRAIAGAKSIDSGNRKIVIYNPGIDFPSDYFNEMRLRAVVNGGNQSIKIIDSAETDTASGKHLYNTELTLENWFDNDPEILGDDPLNNPATNIWYFEIVAFKSYYIVSNKTIVPFSLGDDGQIMRLSYWDKDENDYINTTEILDKRSISDINQTGYPGIQVTSKAVNMEGDLIKLFSITPDEILYSFAFLINGDIISSTFIEKPDDCEKLHDRNYSESYYITTRSHDVEGFLGIRFECEIPEQILNATYDKIYMMVDFSIYSEQEIAWDLHYMLNLQDYLKRQASAIKVVEEWFNNATDGLIGAGETVHFDTIPKIYYNETPDDATFHNKKAVVDISSLIGNNKALLAYPRIEMHLALTTLADLAENDVTFTIKEIAFIGEKAINVINQDIFLKLKGETI